VDRLAKARIAMTSDAAVMCHSESRDALLLAQADHRPGGARDR
jgi:hypothetical protein